MPNDLPAILEEALHIVHLLPACVVEQADRALTNPDADEFKNDEGQPLAHVCGNGFEIPTLMTEPDDRGMLEYTVIPGKEPELYIWNDDNPDTDIRRFHPCWRNPQPWWREATEPKVSLASRYVWDFTQEPNDFRVNWLVLDILPYEHDPNIHDIVECATSFLLEYNAGFGYHDEVANVHAALANAGFDIDERVDAYRLKHSTRRELLLRLRDLGLGEVRIAQNYDSSQYTVQMPRDAALVCKAIRGLPRYVGEAEVQYVFPELDGERKPSRAPDDTREKAGDKTSEDTPGARQLLREQFHALWSKAAGAEGYNKQDWQDLGTSLRKVAGVHI